MVVTFDEAVEQTELRQRYLDEHCAPTLPAFATNCLYMDQDGRPWKEWLGDVHAVGRISADKHISAKNNTHDDFTMFVPSVREEWGKGRSLPIFVNPQAFSNLTEAGLDNLVLHEGVHLADYALGIPLMDGARLTAKDADVRDEIVVPYIEMRAYASQLSDHIRKGKILIKGHDTKWDCRSDLIDWFTRYDNFARQRVGVTETEGRVLASALELSNFFGELVNAPYSKLGNVCRK